MNLSFQPPEQDDPRDDDERMREVDKTPFEFWHDANGNNTQGIGWVDKLVRDAWDAGAKNTLLQSCQFTDDEIRMAVIVARDSFDGPAPMVALCTKVVRVLEETNKK